MKNRDPIEARVAGRRKFEVSRDHSAEKAMERIPIAISNRPSNSEDRAYHEQHGKNTCLEQFAFAECRHCERFRMDGKPGKPTE